MIYQLVFRYLILSIGQAGSYSKVDKPTDLYFIRVAKLVFIKLLPRRGPGNLVKVKITKTTTQKKTLKFWTIPLSI